MTDLNLGEMTKEERLEFYKGDGKPVAPEGFNGKDATEEAVQSYETSLATNERQIAYLEAELEVLAEIARKEAEKEGKFAVQED